MPRTTPQHPHLERLIQAEADRLVNEWGRVGIDPRRDEGYTLVFGLTDDVQHGMTKVYNDGRVER